MPDSSEPVGFTEPERAFLQALVAEGVDFIIVGATAARLQGAAIVTEDIDLWFPKGSEEKVVRAAKAAGIVYVPAGIAMNPPVFGGKHVRFDQVLSMSGLEDFEHERKNTVAREVNGIRLQVLGLDRIVRSKRAAGRDKDKAALPALEAALIAAQHKA